MVTYTKIIDVKSQVYYQSVRQVKTEGCSIMKLSQLHSKHIFCSSSAGQTPQKMRQLYNSELLDIYCSQCCKKVNLLNDLEARLRNLKANR